MKRPKRKKLRSLSSLESKLDRVFSDYIRLRDADAGGTVICVTCGRLMFWRDSHAGHFVKRQHRATRYELTNVHPQCTGCNTFNGGRQDEYAAYILKRYGLGTFNHLMAKKHLTCKRTRSDLESLIEVYKLKLEALQTRAPIAHGAIEWEAA